jgi:hypothetical protein
MVYPRVMRLETTSRTSLPRMAGWAVQRVPAYQAAKPYVCPHCHNPIPARQGHVVAWPEVRVEERRHWHLHCWRVVAGRGRIA